MVCYMVRWSVAGDVNVADGVESPNGVDVTSAALFVSSSTNSLHTLFRFFFWLWH